jgi:hypothetical protein
MVVGRTSHFPKMVILTSNFNIITQQNRVMSGIKASFFFIFIVIVIASSSCAF